MGDFSDRYELGVTLGEGGSAVLYRARDRLLDREVAIKRMRATGWPDVARERFETEARILARLHHPHIAKVFDAGEDSSGVPYIAMELLAGETLESTLTASPVDPSLALAWAFPVLGALAVAHDAGVLHRDIKPSNLFLCHADNGRASPVLIDFGIAKQLGEVGLTGEGVVLGTPAFMSPEQAAGEPLARGSDIWSLGVVLYRLLAGRLPFEGASTSEVLAKVCLGVAPSLTRTAPWVPPGVAATVDRALRPAQARPSGAREFARMLLDAAIASDIPVPQSPDVLGLPDWDDWRASAHERGPTRALAATTQPESLRWPPQRVARWLAGAVSLLLLSVGALAMVGRSMNTNGHPSREMPSEQASAHPTPTATVPDATRVRPTLELIVATPVTPHVAAPDRSASRRRERPPRDAVSSPPPAPAPPSDEPTSTASRLPDVVDSWDL